MSRRGSLLGELRVALLAALLLGLATAPSRPASADASASQVNASVCRLIEDAARRQNLPADVLTRLIWRESSFRATVISRAGAQGIAQFMPATAGERGLSDPFDPEEAIPKAAELLADLERRFGNLGLAAAAYNAGSARVTAWLSDRGDLPLETRAYVVAVTLRSAEDWRAGTGSSERPHGDTARLSCEEELALVRKQQPALMTGSALLAPWGVQLAGSFSKAAAVAAYAQRREQFAAVLRDAAPMVIGGRVPSRGFRPYYQVRFPAPSRVLAIALCDKVVRLGGACSVSKS